MTHALKHVVSFWKNSLNMQFRASKYAMFFLNTTWLGQAVAYVEIRSEYVVSSAKHEL